MVGFFVVLELGHGSKVPFSLTDSVILLLGLKNRTNSSKPILKSNIALDVDSFS